MKGELSDEEDKEKYCVDFFRKGYEQDESQPPQPQSHGVSQTAPQENEDGDNDASFLFNTKPSARAAGPVDNAEHKRFIRYENNTFHVLLNNCKFNLLVVMISDYK